MVRFSQFVGALAALVSGPVAVSAAAERPNVLLICIDDLKPLLGCYGDTTVKSPNIDRLAARGVLYERAYCNQAVCSPSRNALLTGLRSQTLGIYDLGTNFRKAVPDAVTLPQYFKNHGYHTQGMGKIFHVGHGNHVDAASWSVPHFQVKSIGYALKENQAELTREGALFSNQPAGNLPKGAAYESADVPDNAYGDGKLADEAVRRIREAAQQPGQPFFIAVGFVKPHLPFCAPQKYWDMYDRASFQLAARQTPPDGAPSYAPQFGGELRNYRNIPEKGTLPDDLQRTLIHGYHAATSYMDAQLGRVLDALDQTGLSKNTLVVLWGDHGWHLGDHGIWCKHTNYEQAARIPVIVAAPGDGKAGAKSASLIESVDIYPTLCELAALPAPKELDGTSFAATVRNPSASTKEAIVHVYPRGERIGRAVRTARYRLVEWKKPGTSSESADLELYDYERDPEETKNLASAQPEIVAKLRSILGQHPEAKPQIRDAAGGGKKAANSSGTKRTSTDRAALFARKDKNGDGKLTKEEFLANQPDPDEAPKRWTKFDANNDGFLTKDEFVSQGKN
jgi:iduronate 2-sulfatase